MPESRSPKTVIWILVTISVLWMGILATCIPWNGLALHNKELHRAAADGNLDKVRRLISTGVDPSLRNENGETPLFYAIYGQHYQVADFLLSKNADINARNHWGKTVLGMVSTSAKDAPGHDAQIAWIRAHGGVK